MRSIDASKRAEREYNEESVLGLVANAFDMGTAVVAPVNVYYAYIVCKGNRK